ncbi:hypothetical protein GS464_18625 [Rhodococcus hoagii]|nr:hypothetical protein [Prescottella equi]
MTDMNDDTTYDVVVVGSERWSVDRGRGRRGRGLGPWLWEKADVCGGATAWSGGWMWARAQVVVSRHADGRPRGPIAAAYLPEKPAR